MKYTYARDSGARRFSVPSAPGLGGSLVIESTRTPLEALGYINELLVRPGSMRDKCTGAVRALVEIVDADYGSLRVLHQNPKDPPQDSGLWQSSREVEGHDQILSSLAQRAIETKSPAICDNNLGGWSLQTLEDHCGMQSAVALPIIVNGRVLAVIEVASTQDNHFSLDRLQVLRTAGNSLGLLIDEADRRSLRQENTTLQFIDELARIISSNLDLGLVYEQFATEVRRWLDIDWLGITILDIPNASMRLEYLSKRVSGNFLLGQTVPLPGTFSAEAIRTGTSVIIDDLSKASEYWTAKPLNEDGLRSNITVPLFAKDRPIATLVVLSQNLAAYGPLEKDLLERLAVQISPAVENSILFQEAEQRAMALASIGEGVTFLDANGNFQFVNRAFEEMYGSANSDLVGKPYQVVVPDEPFSRAQADEVFTEGLKDGWHGEVARYKQDGAKFYVELTMTPVQNRDGQVIGAIGVSRDITERKRSQEELLLRNQELETLVHIAELLAQSVTFEAKCKDVLEALAESVQAQLVTLRIPDDNNGGLRLISQAGPENWAQQAVLPRRTVSGEAFAEGAPAVVNDYLKSPLAMPEEVNRGIRSMVSLPIRRGPDQRLGVVNVMSREKDHFTAERIRLLTAITGGIGSLLENARLYQQITSELEQRQRAENALKESESRFRQLYDEAPVGYHEMDRDGRINRVNITELDMLGYTAEEMLGQHVWNFYQERDPSLTTYEAKITGAAPPGRSYERTFIRKDGATISTLIEDRPLFDEHGAISGFRSTIQDITERKQTEERLRETAKLISVGELAAGVAHEINNPLTVVSGFSEMLADGHLGEPANGYARMVHSEAQRATKVVQNLLSFARRHDPEMQSSNLREIVESALELKSYDFKNKDIEVVTGFPDPFPNTMLDQHQLLQVFTNLLTNAEQAMEGNRTGRIVIKATSDSGHIRVSVSDNGSGIRSDILPKIFDPFFTTKEVGSGTGLGLSICYGIIKQHQGEMWAESQEGRGATFHIELPVTGAEADTGASRPQTGDGSPPRQRILVVDDEPAIRELLTDILSTDGHQVETASNALDAWKLITTSQIDLLLLDLRMPGDGGEVLYEWVSNHDRSLAHKTVFVTGDTAREEARSFVQNAGNPVLSKPFSIEDLRTAIRMLS